MKKQDAAPFANALVIRFKEKLTTSAPTMPKRQREDLINGFTAGVEHTFGALVHLKEVKLED